MKFKIVIIIYLFLDPTNVNTEVDNHLDSYDSPLHFTVMSNDTDCTEMLIENGADVNQCNELHYTPLHKGTVIAHILNL